jgi:hypothetical protein
LPLSASDATSSPVVINAFMTRSLNLIASDLGKAPIGRIRRPRRFERAGLQIGHPAN